MKNLKTLLAAIWFLFVVSLVAWWWIYFLENLSEGGGVSGKHRMIMWEGSILLSALVIGGMALIFLTYRDERRHEQLKTFFATFSHDIKTSITRLRLQSEVLQEENSAQNSPVLKRLINDIARLDLQLENSLWIAASDVRLLAEKMLLSKLIESLRIEWSELDFRLSQDVEIIADKRAMNSILRNIIQNAVLHGQATAIEFSAKPLNSQTVELSVRDNGNGFSGNLTLLGNQMLPSQSEKGSGVGLFLCRRLLKKMDGDLFFEKSNPGLRAVIRIPGRAL